MTRWTINTHAVRTLLMAGMLVFSVGCGGAESRKEKHVERGQEFMAERNYEKARLEFRNALQIDPKDSEARTMAGLAAEGLGRYDEAAKMYRIAIQTDESLVLPRARLGRLLALAGLPEDALEVISPGLEGSPGSAELLSVRALAKVQQGDPAGARKDAEAAVASEPRSVAAVSTLAGMLWREGKQDDAVALMRKALGAAPEDIELHLLLGRLMLEADRLAEAEKEFAEVVRLDPKNIGQRFELARVYLGQDKPERAIATLREAIKMAPANVDAKIALLQVLAANGSMQEVEKEIASFRSAAPRDYNLQLRLADFYLANGLDQQAEHAYRDIVREADRSPQAQEARSRIAGLRLRASKLDEAAQLAAEVLSENPADADALAVRAEIALQRGDTASAISDLRVAYGNQPDSVPLAAALARAHLQASQPELAEQVLRSLVQASPGDVQARFALAQFLLNVGKVAQARPVLEQLVVEEPTNLLALEGLARLKFADKDVDGARKSAAAIQELLPGSARGFVLAGEIEQSQRRLDDARRLYEQAAQADPQSPAPAIALMRLELLEGQPERALARVNDGLRRLPDDPILLTAQGDLLMAAKRPEDAARSYAAAIEARPNWAQPYRSLAQAHAAAGQNSAAVAALERGLAATRNSPWIAMDLALLHTRFGNVEQAMAVYEAMLERNPRADGAANNLAMLLVIHRSDSESLARAGRLVERFANAESPGLLDTYGWVKFKQGDYAAAVEALGKALDRAPKSSEIRYHLAMAQLKSGNTVEARRNLEQALAAGSDFPGADEAKSTLESL